MQPQKHTSNFDVTERTMWFERPDRGCLRLTGKDALNWLQGLVTNDVASLAVGQQIDALYLTPQGRMITDMVVFRRADDLLVSVPADLAGSIATKLDFLIFAEAVQISDAGADIEQLTLVSDDAKSATMFFAKNDRQGVLTELAESGATEIGASDAEALRIAAGRARWGVDMNEETIPLEAGLLDRAISQTKGCYVGQEVIVRVLHRGGGRVAKRLMRLTFDAAAANVPAAGAAISIDGAAVGKITSAARAPRDNRILALGYIQRDHANEGAAVKVDDQAATLAGFAS